MKIPDKLTLEQWTAVLDAGMVQCNNLAVIMVTGTLLDECAHDAVVGMIADRLHKSKVIALGLHGINKVEDGTWMRLKTAIKNSILGHLFVEITPEERKEFEQLLLSNRGTKEEGGGKKGYLERLMSDDVFALGGADCWLDFSADLRKKAFDDLVRVVPAKDVELEPLS